MSYSELVKVATARPSWGGVKRAGTCSNSRSGLVGEVYDYGQDGFCELVAEDVRVNDLATPIGHVSGCTIQIDRAYTKMQLINPISSVTTPVSVVDFAYDFLDEKRPAWVVAQL